MFNWNVGSLPNPSTNNPITFTLSGAGYVAITDFLYDGDQFAVYDGSTFLGNTSTPLNDGQFVVNFDAAWANPAFSKAIFPLAAGSHSINVFVIRNAVCSVCNGSGSGLIRAGLNNDGFYSPPIPTLGLIGLAGLALLLGVVGFVLLRRG